MKQHLFVICRTELEFVKILDYLLDDYEPMFVNSLEVLRGLRCPLYMFYGGYERRRDWKELANYLLIIGAKEIQYGTSIQKICYRQQSQASP